MVKKAQPVMCVAARRLRMKEEGKGILACVRNVQLGVKLEEIPNKHTVLGVSDACLRKFQLR